MFSTLFTPNVVACLQCNPLLHPGGTLFIQYPNDVYGFLWNGTPYIIEVYKEKQVYIYKLHARQWTHVSILTFSNLCDNVSTT